jgi:AcrR family transcriptional regulator
MVVVDMGKSNEGEGFGRPRFRQLKPRPGHSGKSVANHQRGRIHAATIELVDEDGYEALTVARIVRAAGVSKRTFYENFSDKEGCFLATYDLIVRHTAREVLTAQRRRADGREQIRAGILAFVREVAENPKPARLALVEIYNAGPAGLERMNHTSGLFETLVTETTTRVDGEARLPPLMVKGIVAGLVRVARARLMAGRERELLSEAGELERWILSLRHPAAAEVCASDPAAQRSCRAEAAENGDDGAPALVGCPEGFDDRSLILSAVTRLSAREGYRSLSVPRIRTAAGVSRQSFDAHFEGVADCFLAALEWNANAFQEGARANRGSGSSWPSRVHRALTGLCEQVASDSVVGKASFVEAFAPGQDAVHWRVGFTTNMSEFLRESAPPDQRPTAVAAEASVVAVCTVLRHCIATGHVRRLGEVAGMLSYLVLAPVIGARDAAAVIRAERERPVGMPEPALSGG